MNINEVVAEGEVTFGDTGKNKTCSMLKKLQEGILGAKTFLNIPKWEVEDGPIPRTFFIDRLNRNADKPINDEAVMWLVKLYNAQLGLYKMKEPVGKAERCKLPMILLVMHILKCLSHVQEMTNTNTKV